MLVISYARRFQIWRWNIILKKLHKKGYESQTSWVDEKSWLLTTCPASCAPLKLLIFPNITINIPRIALQKDAPNVFPMFPGKAMARLNPAHAPTIRANENQIENAPSFPWGEQSSHNTLPNACSNPARTRASVWTEGKVYAT